MFKRTLLATAAAGFIAASALATTPSAASAHSPGGYGPGQPGIAFQLGGPGWSVQLGNGFNQHPHFVPQKVCAPVVKKVKWWDNYGNPHWSKVVVGQKCSVGGPGQGFGGPGFGGPGGQPGNLGGNGPGWGGPGAGPGPGWGGN